MKLNIGCGPHRARAPWVNVDRVNIPGKIEPDIVLASGWPGDLSWTGQVPAGSVTHCYLGHVLEHVPWDDVPRFLKSVRALLTDDGNLCVVCPDIYRTIDGYKAGTYPKKLVRVTLEDGDDWQAHGESFDGARHQWNAYEERIVRVVEDAGFTSVEGVRPRELDPVWPLVAPPDWQCAVTATVS